MSDPSIKKAKARRQKTFHPILVGRLSGGELVSR
tara:strand:+ start:527 stop:628 length:102 start_codon:yes stop_codon:yes gene_type:complete